jgi:hypothetical protein
MLRGFKSFIGMARPPELCTILSRQKKLGGDVVAGTDRFPVYRIEMNSMADKTLLIVSGHHGDEQAGPMGVLEYLEDRPDEGVRILAYPLLNAAGYEKGVRNDRTGKDVNRTFYTRDRGKDSWKILRSFDGEKIRLVISVHEHPEIKGFYAYYDGCKALAEKVRDAAEEYFTIQKAVEKPKKGEPWVKDLSQIRDGLIKPPHIHRRTIEDKLAELGLPVLTTETPGLADLPDRVKFIKEAITLAAAYVRKTR